MAGLPTHQGQGVEAAGRALLQNAVLRERAIRIGALTRWIQTFPEVMESACSRRAVEIATWFQDAWCVQDVAAGRFDPLLILATPPTDLQRERAADVAKQALSNAVDEATLETAGKAIRSAGQREPSLLEAVVLAEASSLDATGPLWLIGQAARYAAENKPLATVVDVWQTQLEYQYWAKRIAETLRFERSRELARERLSVLEPFMLALRSQLDASDRHLAPQGAGR